MEKHIYLEINNFLVAFSVSVNDINLVTSRFHQAPSKQLSINQWVFSGENTLKINIAINPKFTEELTEQSFDIEIIEYAGTKPDYAKKILKRIEWKYVKDETIFPVNIIDTFQIDVPYGDWIWRNASPLNEETIDTESLISYIQNIHHILDSKDYSALEQLLEVKTTELAKAYYIPINQRLKDQKSFFTDDLFSDPNWGMQPIDITQMQLIFHAGGRMVEVLSKKGKPFLQAKPGEDSTFGLPLRLCLLDGKWVLCR